MASLPVVAHCADPFLPSTTVWMFDQIRTLQRYRSIVLTQTRQNEDQFPFEPVFSAEDLPFHKQIINRMAHKVCGTYRGYGQWLIENEAQLIHAHFGQEGCRCLAAKKKARIPMVTTFYGMDVSVLPRLRKWRKRFQRLFFEGELFLAEGPFMGERLITLGCPANRVVVQHLGVDLTQIGFEAEHTNERPVVLTYAVFREKKGVIYAIRAFAKVVSRYPQAELRMIGDGPLRSVLEAEVDKLGIGERVIMLGLLPHEKALEELKRAAVLIYPSVTASDGDTEGGAPVALIEAMAMGVPVVASHHADIPEVVPNEKCGFLFPERDVDGLAEGLDALLESTEKRKEMGRAGRLHVEAQHDLQKQAAKLEAVYDRVV
ncbi:MAG: glycosyltransferase, partial [Candidatus Latescibacteria bacterium]|nr:glycosyltransferase [Candidatus Latescibacterota bacterium]